MSTLFRKVIHSMAFVLCGLTSVPCFGESVVLDCKIASVDGVNKESIHIETGADDLAIFVDGKFIAVKNSDSQYVKIEQFKIRFGQKIANAFYISDVIDRITGDYTRSEGHSLT